MITISRTILNKKQHEVTIRPFFQWFIILGSLKSQWRAPIFNLVQQARNKYGDLVPCASLTGHNNFTRYRVRVGKTIYPIYIYNNLYVSSHFVPHWNHPYTFDGVEQILHPVYVLTQHELPGGLHDWIFQVSLRLVVKFIQKIYKNQADNFYKPVLGRSHVSSDIDIEYT